MGTQDNDILGYFKDEHDQAEASTPSVDNLFSNRDGKSFVLPQSCLGLTFAVTFPACCFELFCRWLILECRVSFIWASIFSSFLVLERRLRCRLDREDLVVRGILPGKWSTEIMNYFLMIIYLTVSEFRFVTDNIESAAKKHESAAKKHESAARIPG